MLLVEMLVLHAKLDTKEGNGPFHPSEAMEYCCIGTSYTNVWNIVSRFGGGEARALTKPDIERRRRSHHRSLVLLHPIGRFLLKLGHSNSNFV